MTTTQINRLEDMGFKRWTTLGFDRLYINAGALGLNCTYYQSGNVSSATFRGRDISNCEARRMKASKTYIDVVRGTVHSDNSILKEAVQAILDDVKEV